MGFLKRVSYNYIVSPISNSWNWYLEQPLYIQVGIPVFGLLLIGGAAYGAHHLLKATPSGSNSTTSGSGSSGPSFSSENVDLSSLQQVEDHVSKIIQDYAPSPEALSWVSKKAAPQLLGYTPDHISVSIVEAVMKGKPTGAGISLNNVLPGIFKTSECPRPSIDATQIQQFGDSVLGRLFGTASEASYSNPPYFGYLENLCTKPLYTFLSSPSSENLADASLLKSLCCHFDLGFAANGVPYGVSQEAFLKGWFDYYIYISHIPLPTA